MEIGATENVWSILQPTHLGLPAVDMDSPSSSLVLVVAMIVAKQAVAFLVASGFCFCCAGY